MSENAPTQPVPPTPPAPPAPTLPPGGPHPHPHHEPNRPWYRQVWFIVTASVIAAILVFGAGFVSGGVVGFAIGSHHGVKPDRGIEMPMWNDEGMPWSDDDQSERGRSQRGRGFGGPQSGMPQFGRGFDQDQGGDGTPVPSVPSTPDGDAAAPGMPAPDASGDAVP